MSTTTATPTRELDEVTDRLPVSSIKQAVTLDHYLIAAYDSKEAHMAKIVVIVPSLSAPAWVTRGRVKKPLALALPSLSALTLKIAQAHTHVLTDYIAVREFSKDNRRQGLILGGDVVPAPWNKE